MGGSLSPELARGPLELGGESGARERGDLSRRQLLGQLVLICGGGPALLGSCADDNDPANTPPSDAGARPDASAPADAEVGPDAQADASVDAAPDSASNPDLAAPEDAAPGEVGPPDAGADAVADGARPPGILSVHADDPDIAAQDLTYQSDTPVRAYLATPSRPGSYAGLILIHDDHGLTEHIKDVARRFAKSGCVALVPDLASRAGGTAAVGPAAIAAYLANARPEQLLADLNAGVDALARQAVVGAGRYGVCGLAFGGDLALHFAAANPRLRAAVVYYAATPMPAEIMKTTNAAILGQYANMDLMVNLGIPALERVMMEAGKTFEKTFYNAGHGFNDDTSGTYDEDAAVAAWAVTIGWFDPHLSPLP
jgi:carboxymethylenebutenolidase